METAKDKNPEAYDEGRSAARAGRSIGDNPYWYDCIPKAVAWEDGWFDAHYQMDVDIQTIQTAEDRPA